MRCHVHDPIDQSHSVCFGPSLLEFPHADALQLGQDGVRLQFEVPSPQDMIHLKVRPPRLLHLMPVDLERLGSRGLQLLHESAGKGGFECSHWKDASLLSVR